MFSMKFAFLAAFLLFVYGNVTAQDANEGPVEIESLKDSKCLESVLKLQGYLYKTDLNKPNTPENFYYGVEIKGVEKNYPYLIELTESGKKIKYDQLIPILVEALQESVELLEEESTKRENLELEFANYKITMDNQLRQMQYQLDMFKSELSGFYDSKSVGE